MAVLESLDGTSWKGLVEAPAAVLVLGKSDCEACKAWSDELQRFLGSESEFAHVRFGKLLQDQRGLIEFKRENPWIAQLDVLPFNVIYRGGEKVGEFAGGGSERLANRLRRLVPAPPGA